MLLFAAIVRQEKRQRIARIADTSAAHHGGDFAKKLMQQLNT